MTFGPKDLVWDNMHPGGDDGTTWLGMPPLDEHIDLPPTAKEINELTKYQMSLPVEIFGDYSFPKQPPENPGPIQRYPHRLNPKKRRRDRPIRSIIGGLLGNRSSKPGLQLGMNRKRGER